MEARVEVLQNLLPAELALFDLVELVLHAGGKFHADNILKTLHHQPVHHLAKRRGRQTLVFFDHIFAILDGGDDGGIGRRATDALFLHRAHERRLGVARGRLRKVLLRVGFLEVQRLALRKIGQRRERLFLLVVAPLFIDCRKAGKAQALVRGAEHMASAGGLDCRHVIHGVLHLRGDEPAPDELIQPELVLRQVVLDLLRVERDVTRTDGFVRVLRAALGLIAPGRTGIIRRAIAAFDDVARRRERFFRNTQRIGTHIGDETDRALARDLHTFIKLLRDHHRAARGHVELAGRLLLKRGGDERRRGIALFLAVFHALHRKYLAIHVRDNALHICLTREILLFGAAVIVRREAAGFTHAVQQNVQRPVFLRHERADLIFAVHDQPRRHRLHASGGKPAPHLFPEERAELIADDAVKHAARLLRIDQILIDRARLGDRLAHNVLRDLVERDALRLIVRDVQQIFQMPRNCLALAVRVSCEIDVLAVFRGGAQLGNDGFLSGDGVILRLKIVVNIHAHGALLQVAQMPHARLDLIVRSEIFGDRFRLGRRFHDHQICFSVRHEVPPMFPVY